jgi:hypothetical protein
MLRELCQLGPESRKAAKDVVDTLTSDLETSRRWKGIDRAAVLRRDFFALQTAFQLFRRMINQCAQGKRIHHLASALCRCDPKRTCDFRRWRELDR